MHSRATDRRSASKCQGKWPDQNPRPSVRVTRGAGSGQHLASVLQEGGENANIDAGFGLIWRISTRATHREAPHSTGRGSVFRGTCDAPGEDGAVGGYAQVMGVPPPPAIGRVQTVIGPVTVMGASGVVARVKVGDPVYRRDTIETGADGAVGITFTDGTAFNLSHNARMALNEFVCDGTSNSALFGLSKGVFAFIAGKIAKADGLRIDTPFARIRGAAQDGGIGIRPLAALAYA